ncbi:MAG: hypothetical protein SW833_15090 [Cyanobacteriota bacterium]|nr:hypothetical protein [Cyanobacteriota bacterium]
MTLYKTSLQSLNFNNLGAALGVTLSKSEHCLYVADRVTVGNFVTFRL